MSDNQVWKSQARQDRDLLRFIHRSSSYDGSYRQWRQSWLERMQSERQRLDEERRALNGPWTEAEWALWYQNEEQRLSAAKSFEFVEPDSFFPQSFENSSGQALETQNTELQALKRQRVDDAEVDAWVNSASI